MPIAGADGVSPGPGCAHRRCFVWRIPGGGGQPSGVLARI